MPHGYCWYTSRVLMIFLMGTEYTNRYCWYASQVLICIQTESLMGTEYLQGYCVSSWVLRIVYTGRRTTLISKSKKFSLAPYLRLGLHLSRKDHKLILTNIFKAVKICLSLHTVIMITSIYLSQAIFAINMSTALNALWSIVANVF